MTLLPALYEVAQYCRYLIDFYINYKYYNYYIYKFLKIGSVRFFSDRFLAITGTAYSVSVSVLKFSVSVSVRFYTVRILAVCSGFGFGFGPIRIFAHPYCIRCFPHCPFCHLFLYITIAFLFQGFGPVWELAVSG